MILRCLFAALLLLVAPALAQTKLKTAATFSVLGDLVRQVGGDRIDVAVLVGPDTDTHTYQPTPADARALAGAKVLVSNGLGFEGWLERLAEAASFKGRSIVASRGAAPGPDPHCWQDVACTRRYVANITAGLAEIDPANASFYRLRASAYDAQLFALDTWIRSEIARVPAGKRKVITNHTSFGHFARAYGVEFSAARGATMGSEPSARDLANLIRQAREQKIKALFVENLGNPALVAEIARDSGATVGPPLYSDALSRADGPAPTYEAMMRYNVSALVAGMLKN